MKWHKWVKIKAKIRDEVESLNDIDGRELQEDFSVEYFDRNKSVCLFSAGFNVTYKAAAIEEKTSNNYTSLHALAYKEADSEYKTEAVLHDNVSSHVSWV